MASEVSARFLRSPLLVGSIAFVAVIALAQIDHAQDRDAQAHAVTVFLEQGRFVEAEAEAERLFLSVDNTAPAIIRAQMGNLLVESRTRNGRGAEPRSLQIAEQIVGESAGDGLDDATHATSLRNLGEVLFQRADYEPAISRFRQALLLDEKAAQPVAISKDLTHLARALTETGRQDEALVVCNRALSLSEEVSANGGIAAALQVRGLVRQSKSDYAGARADFERALALRDASDPTHPETLAALTLLGGQLAIDGDLNRSRAVLTRAVSLADMILRSDHPDIAASLRVLAATLQDLGDLSGSRTLRERALVIAEKAFGPNHAMVAVQLNDLANTLLLQGEYSEARPLYERALKIYSRFGDDYPGVTTAIYNLALLHSQLGDRQEARRYYERAIATWTRVLGPDHATVGRALSAYATFLSRQGLDAEAQPTFQRALTIRERALGPNNPLVASTLSGFSASLSRLGQRRRAIDLSTRAIGIWERSSAQANLADGLVIHAQILSDAGDIAGAAQAYDRALRIRLPLLGPAHPSIAEAEVAYAAAQARLRNYDDAFVRALRGDEISRNHARLTLGYLSERQALEYAATRPRGLDLALSLISNGRQGTDVLNALILGRSLTLDEIGSRRRLLVNQTSGTLAPLWMSLASARQRLANLVIRGPDERRLEQYAKVLEDARREKEQAERALAERSAAFRVELARVEIGIEKVRAALPSDAALVSFVRYDQTERALTSGTVSAQATAASSPPTSSYLAFVLKPGTADPDVIRLGRSDEIDALIARWRSEMMTGIGRPTLSPSETERAFRTVGAELRRRIWDPIASHLDGARRVFVVPDDAINLVPLAALPIGDSRYLLEAGPVIHYLSAERDLVETERGPANVGHGLLAIGGPAFADGSLFASLGKRKQRPARATGAPASGTVTVASGAVAALRSSSAKCDTFQSMRFPELPGSAREAQEVSDIWRRLGLTDSEGGSAVIGHDASERAFKQLGPGRRILHLATHGFFLGDQCESALEGTRAVGGLVAQGRQTTSAQRRSRPQELPENPLLFSGLAFAGANRRASAGPEEDDGILTAEEVASLNLEGVEWAVLSACDTGLGQLRIGEGVLGLRRAFQAAGAHTIIMSLWSVEDRSARQWMHALYAARLEQRLDTAAAVREAGLAVLRERRVQGQSSHPFYWAAFVAAGDWR